MPSRPPPKRLCWRCAQGRHKQCWEIASKILVDGRWVEQPCECDCREGRLW